MTYGLGGAADPFKIIDFPGAQRFRDTAGRIPIPPALVAGEDTFIFITLGDSLAANCVNAAYSTVFPRNHTFNIDNGACSIAAEPVLGTNMSAPGTGHFGNRIGDELILRGVTKRAIHVAGGVGGTKVADWASTTGSNPGRLAAAVAARLQAAGLLTQCNARGAIIQTLGSNDTNAGTLQAAFAADQATTIANWTAAGFTCPYYVSISTMFGGTTSAGIQAAQAGVVNGSTILAGVNADNLGTPYRYDGTHWNSAGASVYARAYCDILDARFRL